MEKMEKTINKAVDSLKPESQDKQTGSNDFCEIHKVNKVRDRYNYVNEEPICKFCLFEKEKIEHATKCYLDKSPPKFKNIDGFGVYKPKNNIAKKFKEYCEKFAQNICEGKENTGNLIMIGGVGTGKTHLSYAICAEIAAKKGLLSITTTIPRIIRDIRSTWGKSKFSDSLTEDELIDKFSKTPLLVVDELGSQYGTDSEKIIINEIIDRRYTEMKPTIIIGNITVSQIKIFLGDRSFDRIMDNGKVLVFDWESYRKPIKK